MAKGGRGFLTALMGRGASGGWRQWRDRLDVAGLVALRRARTEARAERREIDRFLAEADERLALPPIGSDAMRRPPGTDWAWRPALWRLPMPRTGVAAPGLSEALDDETSLFHDCPLAEFSLRQARNGRETDLAAFSLHLDVLRFQGNFVSLAIRLPDGAVASLTTRHLVRVECDMTSEAPAGLTLRLNVKHGPNVAELVAGLEVAGDGRGSAEFDLAHAGISENRIEKAWLDVIFIRPAMNRISLSDLILLRRPRANF